MQKKVFLLFIIASLTCTLSAQVKTNFNNQGKLTEKGKFKNRQIEIKPYVRLDWYPEFSYNYSGRYSTDYLKMQGTSWGIDLSYKIATKRKINYKIGVGYLKYKFNKLAKVNSNFGPSDSRIIDYPSQIDVIYSTNKYLYNLIPLNVGVEKILELNSRVHILTGIEINNFFTFSQAYNINRNLNTTYRVNDKSFFGHSFQLTSGILKQYKQSSIAPLLSVPVYTIWQKDDVFRENEKERRGKWFNGFSLGFQYNFSIKK